MRAAPMTSAAIRSATTKAPSSLEAAFDLAWRLLRPSGLPVPVAEHRFDPGRRWRFDRAFPTERVAVELEGGAFSQGRHTRGRGFIADIEKYNRAALLGWLVLRFAAPDLRHAQAVVDQVAAALRLRGAL